MDFVFKGMTDAQLASMRRIWQRDPNGEAKGKLVLSRPSMNLQLKLIGGLLALAGFGLFAWALSMVYRPLCPAFIGLACLYFAMVAFKQVSE